MAHMHPLCQTTRFNLVSLDHLYNTKTSVSQTTSINMRMYLAPWAQRMVRTAVREGGQRLASR